MSTFTGAKIAEIRIYDDPSNPEESAYKVVLPISVLDAIFDQNTGQRLDELLTQQNQAMDTLKTFTAVQDTAQGDAQGSASGAIQAGEVLTSRINYGYFDDADIIFAPMASERYDIESTADGIIVKTHQSWAPYKAPMDTATLVFFDGFAAVGNDGDTIILS